ncbi:MAG: M48 metallopeptidase family protein [Candidatus Baldrarchaeia archaeon]
MLPKNALRYIIVHEIAYIFVKKYTRKFWKIVKTIYPNFKVEQDALEKYKKFLSDSFERILDQPAN